MGHDRRMLNQAFHATQTFGQNEHLATGQKPRDLGQTAAHHRANHAAETAHLPPRQLVLGMAGQAGIDHPFDFWMPLQPGGDVQGVGTVPLHAQRQGFQAAQDHEAVERAGDRADGVLQVTQPLGQLPATTYRYAADDIGMAVQVLGRRMDDDIETGFQRSLRPRRGEGIVGHRQNAARAGHGGDHLQVHQFQQRIAGGFHPDHPRFRCQRRLQRRPVA